MTGITEEGFEIDRDLAPAPADVFRAWTTAEGFAAWFGGDGIDVPADRLDFVAEPGRTWKATMVLPDGNEMNWTGEIVEVTPDRRFVFTLTDQPQDPARAQAVVELSPLGEGTRLHFTQEAPGFSDEQKQATIAGWEHFIDALEAHAAA